MYFTILSNEMFYPPEEVPDKSNAQITIGISEITPIKWRSNLYALSL
ncbi:hypothetical protein ES708_15023 [subsurface metagenome]